ncbi:MAG: EI24 domain-containing protein [Flavobacteriales bacterium]
MNQLFKGILDCLKAHRFVMRNKLGWVYLIPILFSMIMVAVIFKFTDNLVNVIVEPLVELFQLGTPEAAPDPFWDKIMYGLKIAGEYTLYGIIYLFSYYIFFKIQKYIVLIAMAPLMAYLSEKAEEILMDRTYAFNFNLFLKDVWRGILIAIRNMVLEIIVVLLIGIVISGLSMVLTPLAAIAAPLSAVLIFLVSSYYFGYSSFDYLNERKRLAISAGNRLIWDNKWLVTGNGMVFSVLILMPVLGLMLAPVLCPIGAVISSRDKSLHWEMKDSETARLESKKKLLNS